MALGFVWSFGYGVNHQTWFGERVTAVVADSETEVAVEVDPLGWVKPLPAACTDMRAIATSFNDIWPGGIGAIPAVRVGSAAHLWRRAGRGSAQ